MTIPKQARFDLESDGLLDEITKIHCLSLKVDDGPTRLFIGHKHIRDGLAEMDECGTIVAHNSVGFDIPALFKVLGWKPKAKVEDTIVMSQVMCADEVGEGKGVHGGHSLAAWGERLGHPKDKYGEWWHERVQAARLCASEDDLASALEIVMEELGCPTKDEAQCLLDGTSAANEWSWYNDEMGRYCINDTDLLADLDHHFLAKREEWDWEQALQMEHQFAKDFTVQAIRGCYVDMDHAQQLLASIEKEMEEIAARVEPKLPTRTNPTQAEIKDATPPKLQFKKDGQPTKAVNDWFEEVKDDDGQWWGHWRGDWYSLPTPMNDEGTAREPLVQEFKMTLAHQQDLKAWLMRKGWIPTMWSFKKKKDKHGKLRLEKDDKGQLIPTQPKFHEKGELCANLEQISSTFDAVNDVVRWVILRHRKGFVEGVISNTRADGTISATGMSCGTPTSRITHRGVANVPKAEDSVVLGKECRAMFSARPGRVMMGVDASGLELRAFANRVGSQEIIDIIVNEDKEAGYEIHTILLEACEGLVADRSTQKNVTYGFLYGASDRKLGQTAGWPDGKAERVGAKIRKRMVEKLPGLEALMERIQVAVKRGHIKGLDGRKIKIRSPHAALNTLLQSDGSILVKWATCYMNAKAREQGLRGWQVIHYHDECQWDCHADDAEAIGHLFVEGLQWAGRRFGVKCPLDGEVKVGTNWAETH